MVGEEASRRPRQVGHEVDDEIVDEHANRGYRDVRERVSHCDGRGTVERIVGLAPAINSMNSTRTPMGAPVS